MTIETTRSMALNTIGQVSVPVENLSRAVAFYRDQLGLPFLFEVPGMAFFDCHPTRLMLSLPEAQGEPAGSSILYFLTDDIQAAAHELADRGVEFLQPPHLVAKMTDHDLWMAFFVDSEANTMALMAEARPPAPD